MRLFKSKWSNWQDMSVSRINEHVFLLQARRHENGKVQFRVERSPDAWGCNPPTIEQLNKVQPSRITDKQ